MESIVLFREIVHRFSLNQNKQHTFIQRILIQAHQIEFN